MTKPIKSSHRVPLMLAGFAILMFGFGFLLVPLYDVMCKQLGINGKISDQTPPAVTGIDSSRSVLVEFVATNNQDLDWTFKPDTKKIRLHPGEMKRIAFYAKNRTKHPMIVQAIPSVTPSQAAKYIKKTECFCFTQQQLAAQQEMNMPVLFHLDAELPKHIKTVTLAYTLFDVTQRYAGTNPELMNKRGYLDGRSAR